jgi:hypothetical protein
LKYFEKIENLPVLDLYTELSNMLKNGVISYSSFNQISLNTIPSQPDNFNLGTGSLYYDWSSAKEITNPDGTLQIVSPKYDVPLQEEDFSVLCTQFEGTLFEEVYKELSKKYKLGRVRIIKMGLRYCMSWHNDTSPRLHFPIKTQQGCFMVIEDEVKHLEQGEWWITDTTNYHTAFNASSEERIHLVAAILGKE